MNNMAKSKYKPINTKKKKASKKLSIEPCTRRFKKHQVSRLKAVIPRTITVPHTKLETPAKNGGGEELSRF